MMKIHEVNEERLRKRAGSFRSAAGRHQHSIMVLFFVAVGSLCFYHLSIPKTRSLSGHWKSTPAQLLLVGDATNGGSSLVGGEEHITSARMDHLSRQTTIQEVVSSSEGKKRETLLPAHLLLTPTFSSVPLNGDEQKRNSFLNHPSIHSSAISAAVEESNKRSSPQYLTVHSSVPQRSKYAYVFMYFGINPSESVKYRYAIAHALISSQLCRNVYGSNADILMIASLSHQTNEKKLPAEDEALLERYGVRLFYMSKIEETDPGLKFAEGGIYRQFLRKLWVFQLPETYQRVMFLDTDVLMLRNMDYLMEWSESGILKPLVLLAGHGEPANAGTFIVEPNHDAFSTIRNKFYERAKIDQLTPQRSHKDWDKVNGWGVALTDGDMWLTNVLGRNGTEWNFHGAHTDQGFLYHYCRFMVRNCTQVLSHQIQIFEPSPGGLSTTTSLLPWNESSFAARKATNVEHFQFKSSSPKMALFSGGKCVTPWDDFIHWTGDMKPWKNGYPLDPETIRTEQPSHTAAELWWHMFFRTKEELGDAHMRWFESILPLGYPNNWTIALDTPQQKQRYERKQNCWPKEDMPFSLNEWKE